MSLTRKAEGVFKRLRLTRNGPLFSHLYRELTRSLWKPLVASTLGILLS
jgi:hypothetical protein